MNMKQINLVIQGYKEKVEMETNRDDALAWNIGRYVQQAIAAVMNKNSKYPKLPATIKEEDLPKPKPLTDSEMEQVMVRFANKF